MNIKQFIDIVEGRTNQEVSENDQIEHLYIDTRQISQTEYTIFCALTAGERNGHNFIKDAYEKGIRHFLISEKINPSDFHEPTIFITVEDTLQAIQKVARHQRELFPNTVIGITGSNGKTIVKEWLSGIISQVTHYQKGAGIIKSPKSYNSQIGVPLSVWRIQKENTLAIFEAGISKVGEMDTLESIIRPEIGVFTNIGDAHGEFFLNNEEKLTEKLKLFRHSRTLIYHSDNDVVNRHIHNLKTENTSLQLFSWSERNPETFIYIKDKKLSRNSCDITFIHESNEYKIRIPFTQEAYIQNALLVITILMYLKIPFENIISGISQLKAVAMRLEVRDAIHNSNVISDTYNSDITSLKVALDFLSQQYGNKKSIILSDIKESGLTAEDNISQIIRLIQRYNLIRFIGIGNQMKEYKEYITRNLSMPCFFFSSTDAFLNEFSPVHFQNEIILLKGARSFEFERIQHRLELSIHQTVMEVNLNALAHNFNEYKKQVSPDTRTMAMVKAFSYGHGGLEIAQKLQYAGAHYLAVAYADEGIELRNGGVTLPIMVMSPEISGFESMLRWKLEPEIFNIYSLKLFCDTAAKHETSAYPVHIKIDTGMHRLGFMKEDLDELIGFLNSHQTIKVASIFTHLAGSDNESLAEYTHLQTENFNRMSQKILDNLDYIPLRHISNTAAIVNYKNLEYEMVRIGIGMYGINNTQNTKLKLQNVSTLKTYIVQIRHLEAGETVGYNRKGRLEKPGKIATVAIGYADGYRRLNTDSKAYMLVNGYKAPIIGTICMDMCMLDVTDIPEVQEGDEVIVFGEKLSLDLVARWSHTIPYEVLTGISKRVKRLYIND